MTYKSILAVLSGTDRDAWVLKGAISLAMTFEAHVDAVFVRVPAAETLPILGEGFSSTAVDQLMRAAEEESERREKEARQTADRVVRETSIPTADRPPVAGASFAVRTVEGREDLVLTEACRLADVTVIGQAQSVDPDEFRANLALEAVLIGGSRPVLALPGPKATVGGRTVAVAWDGGREATHAVAGALPLLQRADQVHVLTATKAVGAQAGKTLTAYLGWHGIAATAHHLEVEGDGTGKAILDGAKRQGCDLLVMGGYGHSRLREMVLGGVTRHVLANTAIPTLLAH